LLRERLQNKNKYGGCEKSAFIIWHVDDM